MDLNNNPKKLYRYSKREWLEQSLNEGKFSLNSATYIKSMENDSERQDDEMKVTQNIPKEKATVYNLTSRTGIPLASNITKIEEIATDYYMLCLSTRKESYLFDIFKGSDACLVIHDVDEFRKRILMKTKQALPGWECVDKNVQYGGSCEFDLGPLFLKPPIPFAFQFEWRFVWLYLDVMLRGLRPMDFEIGNMEDIAELIDRF